MPRATKFPVNTLLVATVDPSVYSCQRMKKGSIIKVIYDQYAESYYGIVLRNAGSDRILVGATVDYHEQGVRIITRADVAEVLKQEALDAMADAQKKFKIMQLYQQYPTPEAELLAFMEQATSEDATPDTIAEAFDKMSFKVEPLDSKLPTSDDFEDEVKNFF